jgi:hypothetical protein
MVIQNPIHLFPVMTDSVDSELAIKPQNQFIRIKREFIG